MIERETFLSQIESVQPGTSKREITQQSSCVAFKDGRLITFNKEIYCSTTSGLNDVEGAVKYEPLVSLLRALSDEHISVYQEDSQLIIKGSGTSRLTLEKEVLMPIDVVDAPKKWYDCPDDLTEGLDVASKVANPKSHQEILQFIHITPKFIEGTDNTCVARYYAESPLKHTLLRAEFAKPIQVMEPSEVGQTSSWIHFKNAAGLHMACRISRDKYISNIEKAFDVSGEKCVFPETIRDSIRNAGLFSAEKGDVNRIKVGLKPGKVMIKGEGVHGSHTKVHKIKYNGESRHFYINPDTFGMLVSDHQDFEISHDRMKVDTGRILIVVALSKKETE